MRRVIVAALIAVLLAPGVPARAAGIGPFAKADYPLSLIDRPLTLPRGMVEGRLEAVFSSATLQFGVFDPRTLRFVVRNTHLDAWDLVTGLAIGITDRLQAELSTAFSVSEPAELVGPSTTSWNHNLNVRLSYLVVDTETFDVAPAITVPFHVDAGSLDTRDVVEVIGIETPARWVLGRHVWLEAGRGLANIGTDPAAALLSFVGGLGVQVSRSFATLLEMDFAKVLFRGDGTDERTLDDAVPVRLTGLLALCRGADLRGGLLLPNAQDGFDFYQLRMGVTVRF